MAAKTSKPKPAPMEGADIRLPHNLEAEKAVLGAILINNDILPQAAELLEAGDFYRDAHKRIFEAMLATADAGRPVDFITLKSELSRRNELEEVNGPAYISALTDGVPRSCNVSHYAGIVRETSHLRQAMFAANQLLARAAEGDSTATDLASEAAERLYDIGGHAASGRPVSLSDMFSAGISAIEESARRAQDGGGLPGLTTGFPDLDDITAGLHPGDLVILAARTSIGKTALALNIGRAAGAVTTVLVFSLEMEKIQLFVRLLSAESGVDSHRLRRGFLGNDDWSRLSEAMCRLDNINLLVDDTAGIGVREVRTRARQVKAERGLGLIIVDYIQLMRGRGRFDNRTQEIGTISRGLKAVAKELGVPVLALAQLNRSPERDGRKPRRPQLSDLRESGDLENDADVVIFIHRPEDEDAEIIVEKQRNGPRGVIRLTYVKECTRFEAPTALPETT